MRPRVTITNIIEEDGISILSQDADVLALWRDPHDDESWRDDVEGLIVRAFRVGPAEFDSMPKLRAVVKHGAGVDNIDIPAATERGIAVVSTAGFGAIAVAEHAVALALAVTKRLKELQRVIEEGRYADRYASYLQTRELSGKTLGLIGCGHIGLDVARICHGGFDMEVIGYDPYAKRDALASVGGRMFDNLDDVLELSDVVSVHAALTEQSKHLIDEAALARMKQSSVLINTSRGGLVDEAALIRALQEGQISGAGIDVFESEPPQLDNPLFGMENVVVTPHMAGVTRESLQRVSIACAHAVLSILKGETPPNLQNPEYREHRP